MDTKIRKLQIQLENLIIPSWPVNHQILSNNFDSKFLSGSIDKNIISYQQGMTKKYFRVQNFFVNWLLR